MYFSKWFCKKFPGFSKISNSSRFDRSNLFFDRLKRKRKNPVLRLKLSGCLDSSQLVGSVFTCFSIPISIPLDLSKIVFKKKKKKGIRSQFFRALSSSSSIPLSIPSHSNFFFFCLFLSQSHKGFLPQHKVRLFYPFFLLNYMHSCIYIKKFQIFELKRLRIFDDFECFVNICWMSFCSCIILT